MCRVLEAEDDVDSVGEGANPCGVSIAVFKMGRFNCRCVKFTAESE